MNEVINLMIKRLRAFPPGVWLILYLSLTLAFVSVGGVFGSLTATDANPIEALKISILAWLVINGVAFLSTFILLLIGLLWLHKKETG